MGEMNWSIIKLFYKYMYTLIKVHSLSRPLDKIKNGDSLRVKIWHATMPLYQLIKAKALTEKPLERGAQNKIGQLEISAWLEADVIFRIKLF